MWPSSLKLFLDIESEEDVVRNRAATSGEDGSAAFGANGGHATEEHMSVRRLVRSDPTEMQPISELEPKPCEATLLREKTRYDIAFSTELGSGPSVSVDLVRPKLSRFSPPPRMVTTASLPYCEGDARSSLPFSSVSVESARQKFSSGGSLDTRLLTQRLALPTVMTTAMLYSRSSSAAGSSSLPFRQAPTVDICCNFCKRNGETKRFYTSHTLLGNQGKIQCPVLRSYVCPVCGATGDNAHTVSYCPLSDGASTVTATRTPRKSCGCKRNCRHGFVKRH